MARKGHPRVPRKIRGERNRVKRLMAEGGYPGGYTAYGLAGWEKELLRQRRKSVARRLQPTVTIQKEPGSVILHKSLLQDAYGPMIGAALAGPTHLPTPMSKRG